MELSPEAIIGLATLFVTCAPSALLVYRWVRQRTTSTQGSCFALRTPIDTATLSSIRLRAQGKATSTLGVIAGINPQDHEATLWNYEVLSFSHESQHQILKRAHTSEYYPTYERHPVERNYMCEPLKAARIAQSGIQGGKGGDAVSPEQHLRIGDAAAFQENRSHGADAIPVRARAAGARAVPDEQLASATDAPTVNGCPPYNGGNASCTGAHNSTYELYTDNKYTMTSLGTGNQSEMLTMKGVDTLIWSTSFIYPDVDAVNAASLPVGDKSSLPLMWFDVPLHATECALYYRVKVVGSRMEGNQLYENITEFSTKRELASDDPDSPGFKPRPYVDASNFGLCLASPNASDAAFYVASGSVIYQRIHPKSLPRELHRPSLCPSSTGPLRAPPMPPALGGLWTWTTTNMASIDALLTSIKNEMRRSDREDGVARQNEAFALYGETSHRTTVYGIFWAWEALHALVLVLGIGVVGVTVGRGGCGRPVRWQRCGGAIVAWTFRARRQPGQKKPRATPLTFRISNIPSQIYKGGSEENLTQKDFEAILNDVQRGLSRNGGHSADMPAQTLYSFAPSAHSTRSFVATATIYNPPAPSQLESEIKSKIGGNSAQLRVELDFFGLTPLSAPEEPDVEIIAVTGLAGHAFGSWKARGSPYMWLRDFLPAEIPNARILTYGYDTKLPGSQSTASIVDLSRKFLESVKTIQKQCEALAQAAEGSPDDRKVFRLCYAVIFFGVPNRGLESSSLNSMVKGQPNEDLVRNLHPDSSFLSLLHQRFLDKFVLEDSKIICIYETNYTATVEFSPETRKWEKTGDKVMMVPKVSATYASINEKKYDQLPINADHSNIVKFSDSSHDDYVIIQSRIRQCVKDAPRVIQERFAGHKKALSVAQSKYVKALNAPDYASFRRAESPAQGTLQWLLRDKMVNSWLCEDKSPFLWVRGAPGQGKTFLSRFILDHLDNRIAKTQEQDSIIYFFFYDQDEQFRTIESFLRSLIKQLLTTTDVSKLSTAFFESDPSAESEEGLWEIFEEIIRAPIDRTIYCVLDALDESEDEKTRQRLSRRMKRLLHDRSCRGKFSPTLKLLITSRPIVDINIELGDTYMELKARPEDLEIVIEGRVTELSHFPADLKKNVFVELVDRAGGTYLWVSIVLKRLKTITLPSLAKVRKIVQESSTDLEELYSSIIEKIMSGDEEEQKLLAWVVYGRRPLTLKELEAALATQMNSTSKASTDDYYTELTPNAVSNAAGIILEIIDNKVHLIHQTAKDFLLKNHQLRAAKFCIGHDPNIYLAKVCMTYLNFEDFKTGPCGDWETLAVRKRQYPLFHYAAHNWHIHVHIQSGGSIDGMSDMIYRLIEPGSTTLLSWGEAAEVQDLHKATDTWEIAMRTNIHWLAEFQSRDIIIDEDIVREAAKSGMIGYNIMERYIMRDDIRFTEAAVHALATNFNEEIVKLLFDRKGDVKVTHAMVRATAANRESGNFVMRLLAKIPGKIILTADLVEVAAKNKEKGEDIIMLLLASENVQIADGSEAAIVRSFDAKVMQLLLRRQGDDMTITDEVVKAAAGKFRGGKEVMELLLDRRGNDVVITEEVIKAAAGNSWSGKEVMKLLLDRRGDDVVITDEVVKAAAGNNWSGRGLMEVLLDRRGDDVVITDEVIKAAAGNSESGTELMELLFSRQCTVKITEETAEIIAGSFHYKVMELLLDCRGDDVVITEEVIKAAAGNSRSGAEVMKLLLDRRGHDVVITDKVIKVAAGNSESGTEVMELLFSRQCTVKITEETAEIIAGSFHYKVMELLLDCRGDDVVITEEVIKAAAGNSESGTELMELLFSRQCTVKITEETAEIIAGSFHYKVMELLLDCRGDDVVITEEVIKAAAGNSRSGAELMGLLLDRRGDDVVITDEVIKAAEGNSWSRIEWMELLFNRRETA
ncbi:hypothetical protein V500_00867 [Pseudogymnoascus sp. VKM F-4518 (FW-2643)]|nr:hypothetical protein V500_00867 [Pseudogymnoascus sp. VKM F-4518 (FW-2643)]